MLMHDVDRYLKIRRALGFKLQATEAYLRHFVRYADARSERYIKASTAIKWAAASDAGEAQRHDRLMPVVRFARFLQAEDARHEIPPSDYFRGWRPRPEPYLFTDHELRRIVQQARQLKPPGPLRPYTYSTLFGLMAATGLRTSEARALQLRDVTIDGLIIRHSKFDKSRLVPLHESTRAALEAYLKRRGRIAGHDPHLFISRRRGKLSHTVVGETFAAVLKAAGIPACPGQQPRLMDLRHTVAVRALEACPETRDQVGRHTLALTTYLGHAKMASTFWYLHTTPQLLIDIAQQVEALFDGGDP